METMCLLTALTLLGCFSLGHFQGPMAEHCAPGWSHFQDSCYVIVNQPDTWFEAEITCGALHGHLVTIESQAEDHFIASLLQKASPAVTEAWIGLLDVVVENQFVWAASEEIPEYTNWFPNQPDNAGLNEDCVELRTDWGNAMYWNDNNCHVKMNYVCERPYQHSPMIG